MLIKNEDGYDTNKNTLTAVLITSSIYWVPVAEDNNIHSDMPTSLCRNTP